MELLAAHAVPAGFVAVDVLRIEAGFILFTQETQLAVTPRELGLAQFARPTNAYEPEIRLVCFRAEADRLVLAVAAARARCGGPPIRGLSR